MEPHATDRAHWSQVAGEWVEWARAPAHDAFWAYRDALMAFVGHGGAEALEVGCGEGRVSRTLAALGWQVTASDGVDAMVDAARAAGSCADYVVADAGDLPFSDARFALVVAYNMLMDLDDMPGALREARRVLRPDGTLVVSLVHPFFDRGRFAGPEPDAPFVVARRYFRREPFVGEIERNGLRMRFAGWSQPLEAYAAALADAGFAITALKEPQPDLAVQPDMQQWTRIPLFLWLKARPFAG